MSSSLEKLIAEYNAGLASDEAVTEAMEGSALLEDMAQDRKQQRLAEKVYSHLENPYGEDPADMVVEKEAMLAIAEYMNLAKQVLHHDEWDIMSLYLAQGWTQQRIADKYEVSQPAIQQRIEKIYKKLRRLAAKHELLGRTIREYLLPEASNKEAHSPEPLGMPHEFLQRVSESGYWYISARGRKHFISKERCLLPEYFKQAFGDDSVACNLCEPDECKKFTAWYWDKNKKS